MKEETSQPDTVVAEHSGSSQVRRLCYILGHVLIGLPLILSASIAAAFILFCVHAHVCILYGVFFGGKQERLRKEYIADGMEVDAVVIKRVMWRPETDKDGGSNTITVRYASGDSWYEFSFGGGKEYPLGQKVPVLVLPGIPESGRLKHGAWDSEWISCLRVCCLLWGCVWAPTVGKQMLASLIPLDPIVIFGVVLAVLFPPMAWIFSRRRMTIRAHLVPQDVKSNNNGSSFESDIEAAGTVSLSGSEDAESNNEDPARR